MGDELLKAILQRSDRLDGLLASETIDPRDRRCAALRQFMVRGDWRRGDLDQTRKLVREVMDDPPEDTALYQFTLASLAMVAMQRGHYAEAREALDFADALAQPGDPAEVHAYRLAERARLLDLQGQSRQGLAKLSQALELPIKAQEPMWYFIKSCRVAMAGSLLEFSLARSDLKQLRTCPESASPRPHPLSYIQMLLDYARGDLPSALEQLRLAAKAPGTIDPKRITSYECEILIRLDRFEEASEILESPRGRELGRTARENLRALDALAKAELSEAREALRRSLQAEEHGATAYEKSAARRLLMELELAGGQPRPAQRILASLDPSGNSPTTLGLRGRLAALTGRLSQAACCLGELEELGGPDLLRAELRLAWELSAATLSRIRLLGDRGASWPGRQDSAPQPQRPGGPPPTTGLGRDLPEQQLVGGSRGIAKAREQIERLARSDAGVLLVGETGTGKEVAARLLHKLSDRAEKPFVPINCGGLSEALIESELFGHEQGAFTGAVRKRKGLFEVAQGGVLLLDEIHAMSPRLQASLLRVLESGEIRRIGANRSTHVDVRVLAAANETLEKALAEGTFRQDLYYRLNQLRIDLPPLRDRPEDIRPLVTHFLDPLFDRYEVVVSEELIQAMQAFDWPGNVRQLKHAVSRMALMAGDRRVLGADLFDAGRPKQKPDSPAASPAPEKQSDALGPPPRSHDTLQRRRYVTDMFRKHRKLTRAQIIRQVGCAPNTATRDLQHFQQEGLIRRVETSGHLRTSYFQWIGSDGQA